MIKSIIFNKGGKGGMCGRIILPKTYLEILNINPEEPKIIITVEDKKIIIKKMQYE